MNTELHVHQRLLEGPSALQRYDGRITLLSATKSKMHEAIVSNPINQDGIFRFSVPSANRCGRD